MWAEHNALHAARIINRAHQDEIIVGAAQNRTQDLPRSSRSKLPKNPLSIRLRALQTRVSHRFNRLEDVS